MQDDAVFDAEIKLYATLVDQVQRYNSIFWQAPVALFAANVLSLAHLQTKPAFLLAAALFNAAFLFAFYRLVLTQRALIKTTKTAEATLRQRFPECIPTFDAHAVPVRAPIALLSLLAFLNLCLAMYAAAALYRTGGNPVEPSHRLLNGAGLLCGLVGTSRRHGVTGIRVFGSMARGDAGPQSDVDLLIEVGADPSPWFPGGLIAELEELLGRRVQVVTERGLDELLRERVLEEAVPL